MDNRIGYYQDGRRVLPELTLDGRKVKRPVEQTMGLNDEGTHFVVLDTHLVKNFHEKIDALKAEVAALTTPEPEVTPEAAESAPLEPLTFSEIEPEEAPVMKRSKRDAPAPDAQ